MLWYCCAYQICHPRSSCLLRSDGLFDENFFRLRCQAFLNRALVLLLSGTGSVGSSSSVCCIFLLFLTTAISCTRISPSRFFSLVVRVSFCSPIPLCRSSPLLGLSALIRSKLLLSFFCPARMCYAVLYRVFVGVCGGVVRRFGLWISLAWRWLRQEPTDRFVFGKTSPPCCTRARRSGDADDRDERIFLLFLDIHGDSSLQATRQAHTYVKAWPLRHLHVYASKPLCIHLRPSVHLE